MAIPGALLLQFDNCTRVITAVLRLYHDYRYSFIDIRRIAADELRRINYDDQMCLTNANNVPNEYG